ncbi:hypothetical protein FCOIX_3620 [Fusarium coicis]|nr:hypothetical protein FCOIX_3620 [Fusarium coicis]
MVWQTSLFIIITTTAHSSNISIMAQPVADWVPAYVNQSFFSLPIVERYGDKFPPERDALLVEVLYTFPNTTSPVKLVQFDNKGNKEIAVLKLYDRTHPGRLRKFAAPSLPAEREYRSWNGGIEPSTKARFEAHIWYELDQRHKTELRAYRQLQSMQGTKIPRLYANVRISLSTIDKRCKGTPEEKEFLSIPGLLLQHCDCRRLSELRLPGMAQIESGKLRNIWANLAQQAVYAIQEINFLGILLRSYNNNAIFRRENGIDNPYIIDFAEAVFKEDLIEAWNKERRETRGAEYSPWKIDVKYWETAKSYGNPAAFDEAFKKYLWSQDIYGSGCWLPAYLTIKKQIWLLAMVYGVLKH